jgi:phage baseplate assembly protein W
MKYRDLEIFFKKNVDNSDISFVSNNSSIVQSIKNIVLTKKGERPFNNYFGTDAVNVMFEQPTTAEMAFLSQDIKDILDQLEPRIIVDSVEIRYPSENSATEDLTIDIKYKLNNSQQNNNSQTLILTVNQL